MALAVVAAVVLERPLATTNAVVSCVAAVDTENASASGGGGGFAPCLRRRGISFLSSGALSLAAAPFPCLLVQALSAVTLSTLPAPTTAPIVVIVIVIAVAVRPLPVRWLPSTPASSF